MSVDSGLAIEKIVDQLVNAHGCKRIYAVTGGKGDPIAEQRAEGFRRAMRKNGLDGGDGLADDIARGDIALPDAKAFALADERMYAEKSEKHRKNAR